MKERSNSTVKTTYYKARFHVFGLMASLCLCVPSASAGSPVLGVGAGAVQLTTISAKEHGGMQPLLRLDGGLRMSARSTARLRVEGFQADGLNLSFSLVAEWQTWDHLGMYAAAGLSHSNETRWGNNVVFGAFARLFPKAQFSPRIDAFAAVAVRNDFLSVTMGSTLGVDYTWGPR
jgi:hypothetical protein